MLGLGMAVAALWSVGAPAEPQTVKVAASQRYDRGSLIRFTFGGGYRDLWKAEIELPVLDIETIGGGLTPVGRFGGLQSAVLAFESADGRAFSFRGTDKDPSAVLPALLRDTVFRDLVQDQMAAQHPGGPLAAGALTQAAGVLTIQERMVVVPDHPGLGEYRDEFAGMVGTFYEYPLPATGAHPGFHGATEIIDYEEIYARLQRGHADRVDAEAFLRARLMDMLLGDFDRHRKQWRWAKVPGKDRWQPIPEDRDQAFVRYDGVGTRMGYVYIPILQCYGPDYPSMRGLVLHGWEQDRWLLTELEWSRWEAIAKDVQARLTDQTIAAAVAALPGPYAELDGEQLTDDVKGRRDLLLEGARSFYEHLADQVNVEATDVAEAVRIDNRADGNVLVEVRARGSHDELFYRRLFERTDTDEIRVMLRGGDDVVTVTGRARDIVVKVVGGEGRKLFDDSGGGGTIFYDVSDATEVRRGADTFVDRTDYKEPPSNPGFVDVEGVPARDWGSELIPAIPDFGYEPDYGLFIGAGIIYKTFAFRAYPWSTRHELMAGIAIEALEPEVRYTGGIHPESSKLLAELDARFSGMDVLNFYGYGNDTTDEAPKSFYRVRNQQVRTEITLSHPIGSEFFVFSAGPFLQYSTTHDGDRLIDQQMPYGAASFGTLGLYGSVRLDTRVAEYGDAPSLPLPFHENVAEGYPTGGVLFDFTGQVSPRIWDAEQDWGSIEGFVAGYASFLDDNRLSLSVRLGGEFTFGEVPYFEAAYLGGGGTFSGDSTIRGFRANRFAGEASLYGNFDARLFLVQVKLVLPMDLGLLGFADLGRVWVDAESSTTWHASGGGGFWIAPLARTNALSFALAGSSEGVEFYMRAGFHY